MIDFDWTWLRNLPGWTPLRGLVPAPTPVEPPLYRRHERCYVLAQPLTRDLLPGGPRAPFVTMGLWAASEGAAKRAALRRAAEDDGAIETPPRQLCEEVEVASYSAILAVARQLAAASGTIERATYASDGSFLQSVVRMDDREFLFRGIEPDADELPYAIAFRLR